MVGATFSQTSMKEYSRAGATIGAALSNFDAAGSFPKPAFGVETQDSDYKSNTSNIYSAAKLNPSDDLKVTVGGSLITYELEGIGYGTPQEAKENNKFTPYIGAVYDLNDEHALYASYAGIYRPQAEIGADMKALAPLKGKNYEVGIKSEWFNKALNSSFALFRTEQENQAQAIGMTGTRTIYEGIQATSKGYEFDVTGEISSNLSVSAGYTRLMSVKDDQDQNVNPFTPRHMAHISTVYKVQFVENLKVGASINWQNDTHVTINNVRYVQDSYAVLNLMANYKIDDHWSAAVNLYNVTDEKYLSSLRYAYAGQAYYAAPINGLATLTWKY